jgi:acetyl-CoA acetyltransferase
MFKNAYIPYGGYYSTPFVKWQGALQNENSIKLAGRTSKRFFEEKGFDIGMIEYLYFGQTSYQQGTFYAAPYAGAEMGINVPGQSTSHACATSTTAVFNAASAVESNSFNAVYCLMGDRLSNAAHMAWPNPRGFGGQVLTENVMVDNIGADPSTGLGMMVTAENVAKENGYTREEADELALMRYEQYHDALANDREFQKRYMFPVEIIGRKKTTVIEADEGVTPTSREALARLKPVMQGGIHTFGSQTHPADGNVGIIVTNKENALVTSKDRSISIQIVSYGASRTKKGFMPAAPVEAARMALDKAGIKVSDLKTIKNHTPFVVNDLHLTKTLGLNKRDVNNYGTSMIFGHPQGPTMGRLLIEAIEETVIKGGGYAMVAGCAAGDNAAALIVKVS